MFWPGGGVGNASFTTCSKLISSSPPLLLPRVDDDRDRAVLARVRALRAFVDHAAYLRLEGVPPVKVGALQGGPIWTGPYRIDTSNVARRQAPWYKVVRNGERGGRGERLPRRDSGGENG